MNRKINTNMIWKMTDVFNGLQSERFGAEYVYGGFEFSLSYTRTVANNLSLYSYFWIWNKRK
jgi:hypothetical protein